MFQTMTYALLTFIDYRASDFIKLYADTQQTK